eukprot:CAMPEP_0197667076 /NCGR_PEP_ID=MMETSP1338-20131121/64988_1 /TAXON_ID=43686 ORGANISM="Pelagodinium beii, Strain RCC1491" /NCGR_SAMPLE_ID=MMETSP1338 /ASSEMBLY_ACC=CAM_ASM_000754 /LENGTH=139 /DNA_ID=CAMNT_0043246239 /DNA_START=1 /DNA_END=421 /DNA_ORIENTATION=-
MWVPGGSCRGGASAGSTEFSSAMSVSEGAMAVEAAGLQVGSLPNSVPAAPLAAPPMAAFRKNADSAMADMEANFDTGIFDFPDSVSQVWDSNSSWARHLTQLRTSSLEGPTSREISPQDAGADRWATHFWDTGGGQTPH